MIGNEIGLGLGFGDNRDDRDNVQVEHDNLDPGGPDRHALVVRGLMRRMSGILMMVLIAVLGFLAPVMVVDLKMDGKGENACDEEQHHQPSDCCGPLHAPSWLHLAGSVKKKHLGHRGSMRMQVPMMQVRNVRVLVFEALMLVRMRVGLGSFMPLVLVAVVLVVHVPVFMPSCLVHVPVGMFHPNEEPRARDHEKGAGRGP